MARQRRNKGRRSPGAEEQKNNDNEEQDEGANGVGAVPAQGNDGEVHAGGNGGGEQAGQQRERNNNDLGENERNVRQNVGPPRPDWSRNHVDLTTGNLVPKQGTISGVAPTAQINPRSRLISITELMDEGGQMRTVLVAMIMRIASAEAADTSTVRQKQSNQRQTRRYQRRLTFMCLKSGGKSNMFMVFHGHGQNDHLLNGMDPSLKYNGALRKCVKDVSFINDDCVPPQLAIISAHRSGSRGCIHKPGKHRQISWGILDAHHQLESPPGCLERQFFIARSTHCAQRH